MLASLALVLVGFSTAHADKARAITSVSPSGIQTTTKDWSLNNGTKVQHLSKRTPDGRLASWQRNVYSKRTGEVSAHGAFFGEKFTARSGNLGGAHMKQTVFGTGANQVRLLEVDNAGKRADYRLEENADGQKVTKP